MLEYCIENPMTAALFGLLTIAWFGGGIMKCIVDSWRISPPPAPPSYEQWQAMLKRPTV